MIIGFQYLRNNKKKKYYGIIFEKSKKNITLRQIFLQRTWQNGL